MMMKEYILVRMKFMEKNPPKDIAYSNSDEIRIKELELELLKLKLKQTNDVSIYG
jgi:hypothetical protein